MSPIIRDVAKTGGKASPGSRFRVLARSEGATMSCAEAVELTSGSLIGVRTIRRGGKSANRVHGTEDQALFSGSMWSCIGESPGIYAFDLPSLRAAGERADLAERRGRREAPSGNPPPEASPSSPFREERERAGPSGSRRRLHRPLAGSIRGHGPS